MIARVAERIEQRIDLAGRQLMRLEHLDGVLVHDVEEALQPLIGVDEMVAIGDDRRAGKHQQRDNDDRGQQRPQRAPCRAA